MISVDSSGDKLVLRIDDDKGVKMTLTRSSVVRVLEATDERSASRVSLLPLREKVAGTAG